MLPKELCVAQGVLHPSGLISSMFASDGLARNSREYELLEHALIPLSPRIATLIFVLTTHEKLTPQTMRGIAYFSSVIFCADEITDRLNTPRFESGSQLKEYLLSQHIDTGRGQSISMADLVDITVNSFPEEEKRNAIYHFLDDACESQMELHGGIGEYGYYKALAYRRKSTGEYARMGALLADFKDPKREEMLMTCYGLWQMFDDALDCIYDTQDKNINLFAGLANDTSASERSTLKGASLTTPRRGFFASLIPMGIFLKKMPQTSHAYTTIFNQGLATITGSNRYFLTLARDVLFKF